MSRIGRRIIMCLMLIAALAIIWNLLGHWLPMCKAGLIHGIRALEVAIWLLLSQEFFRAFLEPSLQSKFSKLPPYFAE